VKRFKIASVSAVPRRKAVALASFGVWVIDQFIVPPDVHAPNRPSESELWWFQMADIVLSAALLAGGADPDPQADGCLSQIHGSLIFKG
jgi:hypothetical protein